jgi:hypothetical protein
MGVRVRRVELLNAGAKAFLCLNEFREKKEYKRPRKTSYARRLLLSTLLAQSSLEHQNIEREIEEAHHGIQYLLPQATMNISIRILPKHMSQRFRIANNQTPSSQKPWYIKHQPIL